jgi:hypothetical protein
MSISILLWSASPSLTPQLFVRTRTCTDEVELMCIGRRSRKNRKRRPLKETSNQAPPLLTPDATETSLWVNNHVVDVLGSGLVRQRCSAGYQYPRGIGPGGVRVASFGHAHQPRPRRALLADGVECRDGVRPSRDVKMPHGRRVGRVDARRDPVDSPPPVLIPATAATPHVGDLG